MKNISILSLALLVSAGAFAQTPVMDANRVILTSTSGQNSVFMIDRVQEMSFARVDGRVAADIDLFGFDFDSITLSITRTPACAGFKIAVLPSLTLNRVTTDEEAISYIDYYGSSEIYYEDFDHGTLSGTSFQPNTDYTVMTYGVDQYGVPCEVSRADFHTDRIPVVGSPYVDMTVDETNMYGCTLTFVPNGDVSAYYFCLGEKGTMQQQYEYFGPMFGFANFGEMIMMWGVRTVGDYTYTYTGLNPNTEYEIFIQALDENDNPADVITYEFSTEGLGGSGDAYVDIALGEYIFNDWEGQMLPSQFLSFTPNDQCSCYRFNVYFADTYDAQSEVIDADLCSDPEMPMAYWFFYEPISIDYQIDPGTPCVAIAAGKNIDGVWGEVNHLRFTTANSVQGAPAMKPSDGHITKRFVEKKVKAELCTPGRIPAVKSPKMHLSK